MATETRFCNKGIILAGGSGTRLYPLTRVANKQLLPIYDKPVIYYPLTTLMFAGIREILIITTPKDIENLRSLLGDGTEWGLHIHYKVQLKPVGLPDAFLIGEDFISHEPVCLILGDNLFHGHGLSHTLYDICTHHVEGAHLFAYAVKDPRRYGVVVLDQEGRPIDIEEKPEHPKSRLAVTGLYFYDHTVSDKAKVLTPSKRGELEITDLNRLYMEEKKAKVHILNRGYVWFDVGTPEAMAQASDYVEVMQTRQGVGIACPEEVAWRMNFISDQDLTRLIGSLPNNSYTEYLKTLIENEIGPPNFRM